MSSIKSNGYKRLQVFLPQCLVPSIPAPWSTRSRQSSDLTSLMKIRTFSQSQTENTRPTTRDPDNTRPRDPAKKPHTAEGRRYIVPQQANCYDLDEEYESVVKEAYATYNKLTRGEQPRPTTVKTASKQTENNVLNKDPNPNVLNKDPYHNVLNRGAERKVLDNGADHNVLSSGIDHSVLSKGTDHNALNTKAGHNQGADNNVVNKEPDYITVWRNVFQINSYTKQKKPQRPKSAPPRTTSYNAPSRPQSARRTPVPPGDAIPRGQPHRVVYKQVHRPSSGRRVLIGDTRQVLHAWHGPDNMAPSGTRIDQLTPTPDFSSYYQDTAAIRQIELANMSTSDRLRSNSPGTPHASAKQPFDILGSSRVTDIKHRDNYKGSSFQPTAGNKTKHYFVINPEWVSEQLVVTGRAVPAAHRPLQTGRRCKSAPPMKSRNPITWENWT